MSDQVIGAVPPNCENPCAYGAPAMAGAIPAGWIVTAWQLPPQLAANARSPISNDMSGLRTRTSWAVQAVSAGVVPVACVGPTTTVPSSLAPADEDPGRGIERGAGEGQQRPALVGTRRRLDAEQRPPRGQADQRVITGHERAPGRPGADDRRAPHAVILAGPRRSGVAGRVQA